MKDFLAFLVVLVVAVIYFVMVAAGTKTRGTYKIRTINGWRTRDSGNRDASILIFLVVLLLTALTKCTN